MKYLLFVILFSHNIYAQNGGADNSEDWANSRQGETAGGVQSGGSNEESPGWKSRPMNGASEEMKGGSPKDTSQGKLMLIPERLKNRRR